MLLLILYTVNSMHAAISVYDIISLLYTNFVTIQPFHVLKTISKTTIYKTPKIPISRATHN